MEEKVLITGKFAVKNTVFRVVLFILAFSVVAGIIALKRYESEGSPGILYTGFFFFSLAFFSGITALIIHLVMSHCEIVVTNKRVYGKVKFGVRVDLPINKISSIGQGIFKSLSIATSSGVIRFWLLENREEVFATISKLLSELQNHSSPTVVQNAVQSDAAELKQYKELLDSGIITQEEFDAKKKQLLNL